MKVLFSHSYFLQLDPKQVEHGKPYPPLGTLLAAALLRENGFAVSLFDTMFAHAPEELIPVLKSFKPDVFVIYDDGFNYLTKMCLSNMREAAFVMQQYARAYGCKVIVTSSDAADHYEKYMEHGADYVIAGEAEYTLLETVQLLETTQPAMDAVRGLIHRVADAPRRNAPRPISRQLDELPLPAWDLVNIAPYKKVWLKKHGYFSINVATTRGCPYKCNWCAKPIYGNHYNMRSPEQVVKEILHLKALFHMDHIWFCDDIFGLKRSWVADFAVQLHAANAVTPFKIQSRADLLVQENYVADLAGAGCEEVWMGAESGSQHILDAMDKGITVEEIRRARQLLRQYNIRAAFFIQYGYLHETAADIDQTLRLIRETLPDDIGISVSYPLPGTKFYDKVKQDMRSKENWTDSDDLDLMYTNTYGSPFYKKLHRYTHYVYRLEWLKQQGHTPATLLRTLKYQLLKQRFSRELRHLATHKTDRI
ncbi:radical SAM protein [Chitinophaga parva]|uniref:Radical SAM protein n=1 Tax=Chitinophaga parva TaxID=2169414 RepID=A0A2T7BD79_9BACT|nr:radical SAM protein [Chitinophaga parva]PUZ22980.1 radical SAM protein [Chitinophaga parva]